MYTLFTLPHGFDFENLTRKQATENLRAFVDRIPERMQQLEQVVGMEVPEWKADLSDASLPPLGEWYARHVEERPVTEKELAEYRAKMGSQWQLLADVKMELTKESYSYGIDIGIYVGECIRFRCPNAEWIVGPGPKSYVNYNMPALTGFGLDEYVPIRNIAGTGVHIVRSSKHANSPITKAPVTAGEQVAAIIASLPAFDPRTMLHNIVVSYQNRAE